MSIENDGFDQYSAEPFEQQQFGTSGIEGANDLEFIGIIGMARHHWEPF